MRLFVCLFLMIIYKLAIPYNLIYGLSYVKNKKKCKNWRKKSTKQYSQSVDENKNLKETDFTNGQKNIRIKIYNFI